MPVDQITRPGRWARAAAAAVTAGGLLAIGLGGGPAAAEPVRDASVTVVLPSPNPVLVGNPVSLTAVVTRAYGSGPAPTGTVTFYDWPTSLVVATLDNGVAIHVTDTLPVGEHAIIAVYSGDANFTPSTSPASTLTVQAVPTATTLAVAPAQSVFGQTVILSALVTASTPGAPAPTGMVEFRTGATVLGYAPVAASGWAILATSELPLGTQDLTATYQGDATHAGSISSSVSARVTQARTTTSLYGPGQPTRFGVQVTFVARVAPGAPGGGIPAGTVQFRDGAVILGSARVDAGGLAVLAVQRMPVGRHVITAYFLGSPEYAQSASPSLSHTVLRRG